jgi:hypothetical protein
MPVDLSVASASPAWPPRIRGGRRRMGVFRNGAWAQTKPTADCRDQTRGRRGAESCAAGAATSLTTAPRDRP